MSSEERADGVPPGLVSFKAASKRYERSRSGGRWRAGVPGLPDRLRRPHLALDRLDLEVAPGESVGLIGPNGAGKSTVLKLVAHVTSTSEGRLRVGGRVGSMIELGLGFHPELTGRENIWTSCAMLGYSRDATEAAFDAIVAFADLAHAIETPLKHYSSGMAARLGFSVATEQHVDVLAVDEVLAVGDREFQERCVERIHGMVRAGTTLLFVSHEMSLVDAVCERAIQLRQGRVVDDGPAAEVVERYLLPTPSRFRRSARPTMSVERLAVGDRVMPWEPMRLEMDVDVHGDVGNPAIGVELFLPTVSPERPFACSSTPVVGLDVPGRYRLVGTSVPLPAEGGLVRTVVTLVRGDRRELEDAASAEFRIGGQQLSGKPHLAVVPEWNAEQVAAPERRLGRASQGDTDRRALVVARNVVKHYAPGLRRSAIRSALPWDSVGRDGAGVVAVDGVDLVVREGESVGIIGPNGSGKSTLLRLVAGVTSPSSGSIGTRGRVVPVLALGLGFHPDLTGLENVQLTGALLGLRSDELDDRLDVITEFAGIGAAVEAQVKQYSTGMRARLGLALALHADADLLLIDELLTVGDTDFRRLVLHRLAEKQEGGLAVMFVSHELRLIDELCDRVVRLEHGRMVDDGESTEVIGRYGGPAWAGGSVDAIGGVRIHEVAVSPRVVADGSPLEVTGLLEVIDPSPRARVELSYRAPPPDRAVPLTTDERDAHSFFVATTEVSGGCLAQAGWHRFVAVISDNRVLGEYDVVVAVVDEDTSEILAESWQPVVVGRARAEGFPGPHFDVVWNVVGQP